MVDNLPTASGDSYTIGENGVLTATAATGVLANDTKGAGNSNPLTAILAVRPHEWDGNAELGWFVCLSSEHGLHRSRFVHVPDHRRSWRDGHVTASITVTATNHAPVATNDTYSAQVGGSVKTTAATGVLANDTDADNNVLTAHLVTGPTNGTLTLNPDGSFTYTPAAGFYGTDTFTYVANDGLRIRTPPR